MQKELKKNTTFDHLFLNNNQISIDGLIIYTDNDQWKLDFNINVNNEENQIWSTLFNNTMDIAKKYASKEFNQGHKILQLNSNKIPNFDIMVAETIANFKKEIIEMQPATTTK